MVNKLTDTFIVFDRQLLKDHPSKAIYLHVADEDGNVDFVELGPVVTPLGGKNAAKKLGYNPTHWLEIDGNHKSLNKFL